MSDAAQMIDPAGSAGQFGQNVNTVRCANDDWFTRFRVWSLRSECLCLGEYTYGIGNPADQRFVKDSHGQHV